MALDKNTVAVGTDLPTLTKPAITRETLKVYGPAAGDPNPMHVDEEFAKNAGVMPRNAAAREPQPCASPCDEGNATSTPSRSSRAMPQSSIACFAASRQNPMALVPGSFPKRESPMPAIA